MNIKKIAKLARLHLSPDEEKIFTEDLQKILAYVEQLNKVSTEGVEPLTHGIPLEEHFREDIAKPLSEEETVAILACSSDPLYNQYRVPQVIGGEE